MNSLEINLIIRPIEKPSSEEIALLWDKYAQNRYKDIARGKDTTYNKVIVPYWKDKAQYKKPSSVLDIGCGVGFLSRIASFHSNTVVGIDPSSESLKIASVKNNAKNIIYENYSVERFPSTQKFDLLIANMVCMDCADIYSFMNACSNLIKPKGELIFTVVNPLYWPRYWKYETEYWFQYDKEIYMEVDFKTAGTGETGYKTIHIHRPISLYVDSAVSSGMPITKIEELGPTQINKHNCPKIISFTCKNLLN